MAYILVIWIGVSYTQTLAISRMDSLAECEAAKAVIAETYVSSWSGGIDLNAMKCLPLESK